MKINVIVATRLSEKEFYANSATGRSITLLMPDFINLVVYWNNRRGLSEVYNDAVESVGSDGDIMVFMHDDVHIIDYFWFYRVQEALTRFDIVGVVGNKSRKTLQPSWAFKNPMMEIDSFENFSGAICHGSTYPPKSVDVYSSTRDKVMLIDGVFMAMKKNIFLTSGIRFDEDFEFHFYDMDFCRQAELLNLACGTWDIALMHNSKGNFSSESWWNSRAKYYSKWGG